MGGPRIAFLALGACIGTACDPQSGDRAAHPSIHRDGWCDDCGAGFVARIKVSSGALFEALDAHGHVIDPDALTCAVCKEACRRGGFCDRCRMGFVNGLAYLSRLTYHIATGAVEDPELIACAQCRKNAASHGWCDACGVGRVESLVLRSRSDLEPARKAFEKLRLAIAALERCETCAVATFTDGGCRFCRVSYRDGVPSKPD